MGTSANDPARPPLSLRLFLLTGLALLAFAGNSLLCRIALGPVGMDAASFTAIRLVSGAAMLGLMLRVHGVPGNPAAATGPRPWRCSPTPRHFPSPISA